MSFGLLRRRPWASRSITGVMAMSFVIRTIRRPACCAIRTEPSRSTTAPLEPGYSLCGASVAPPEFSNSIRVAPSAPTANSLLPTRSENQISPNAHTGPSTNSNPLAIFSIFASGAITASSAGLSRSIEAEATESWANVAAAPALKLLLAQVPANSATAHASGIRNPQSDRNDRRDERNMWVILKVQLPIVGHHYNRLQNECQDVSRRLRAKRDTAYRRAIMRCVGWAVAAEAPCTKPWRQSAF